MRRAVLKMPDHTSEHFSILKWPSDSFDKSCGSEGWTTAITTTTGDQNDS